MIVYDLACSEVERVDIGHPAGAVHDAIGLGNLFEAVAGKEHPQLSICALDPLHGNASPKADPDALAFGPQALNGIDVHGRQQLRQGLENRHLDPSARIDMAQFERDHAAANEDGRTGQHAVTQDLVRSDHELSARDRQWPWLRPRRDHDVVRLQQAVADTNGGRRGERCVALDHLDTALLHRPGETRRNVPDQRSLSIDQGRPVKPGLADQDVMDSGTINLMQGMTGRDQDLLRCAAPVRAGAAEVPRFDHRNRHAGAPHRPGDADAGISAPEDHYIEFLSRHGPNLVWCATAVA